MAPYLGLRGRRLTAAIGLVSGFAFFLFGYDQGDFGGLLTIHAFRERFPQIDTIGHLTSKHTAVLQGTTNAAWNFGCILSSVAAIWLGTILGRRVTIIIGLALLIVGEVIQASSFGLGQLLAGRVIAGIGNGFNTAAVPAWQAETCRAHRRGTYLMITGSFIAAGVATAYWTTFAFAYLTSTPDSWRIPIAFQLIFALPLLAIVPFLPESPRWLILTGRADEALSVLSALSDVNSSDPSVYKEFLAIKDSVLEAKIGGFRAILTNDTSRHLHRSMLAWLIQAFQQLSGVNLVIQYAALILFERYGYSGWLARLLAACLGTEAFLASMVPVVGIDHFWGRRSLLIFGAAGMSASMAVLTAMTWLSESNSSTSTTSGVQTRPSNTDATNKRSAYDAGVTTSTIFLFVYLTFFTIGWSAMAWLYSVEIVPLRIRGPATALSTSSNWLFNSLVVLAAPPLLQSIGWRTFIIFAATNAVIAPAVYFFFPEAAYRTLEEIDVIFHAASLSNRPWRTVVRDSREAPLWYGRDGRAEFDYEASEWHRHHKGVSGVSHSSDDTSALVSSESGSRSTGSFGSKADKVLGRASGSNGNGYEGNRRLAMEEMEREMSDKEKKELRKYYATAGAAGLDGPRTGPERRGKMLVRESGRV